MKHHFYYRLHSGHVELHLSRADMKELHKKIAKALHQRAQGHRVYHVGLAWRGRCWHKLSITSHAANKRHAHAKAEVNKPWVRR